MQDSRELNRELGLACDEVEATYKALHPNSARLHASAARHMPGGNTRSVLHYSPFPLTWAGGRGSRLKDADGLDDPTCWENIRRGCTGTPIRLFKEP